MRQKKKTTRPKDRVDSENRLLQAAKEVFSEHGYDRATTRMVAEKAGINLALITRYFGNKHGLLLSVIRHEASEALSAPLPYPPQKTLLEESLHFAEATFSDFLSKIDLIRIVIVQSITDRAFAEAIRSKDFLERRSNIQDRMAPFFGKAQSKKQADDLERFVSLLKQIILATTIIQFLMEGKAKEACLKDLKAMVRAFCENHSEANGKNPK